MKSKIIPRVPEYEVYRKENGNLILVHSIKGLSKIEVIAKFISFIINTPGFYGIALDSFDVHENLPNINIEINCRWSGKNIGSGSLSYVSETYHIVKI